jgi:hypothetical protein
VESVYLPGLIDKGFLTRLRAVDQSRIHAYLRSVQTCVDSGKLETSNELLDSILGYLREITVRYRKTGAHGKNRVDFSVSKENPKDNEVTNESFISPQIIIDFVKKHEYEVYDISAHVVHEHFFTLDIANLIVPLEFKKSIGEVEFINDETFQSMPILRNGIAQVIGRFAQTLEDASISSFKNKTPLMDEQNLYVFLIEMNSLWLLNSMGKDINFDEMNRTPVLDCSLFLVKLESPIAQLCILLSAYLSDGIVLKAAADVFDFYINPPTFPPFLILSDITNDIQKYDFERLLNAKLYEKAVCLVRDELSNQYCLKTDISSGKGDVDRLKREVQVLIMLNNKAVVRIPELVAHGKDSLTSNFTMVTRPFGEPLEDLKEIELCKYINDLTECLDSLHSSGYLHADISPANIIYDHESGYRLIDFECAIPIGAKTIGRFTRNFCSINISLDLPCYAKDDWESLFYTTLDLLKVPLPWKDTFGTEEINSLKRAFLEDVEQNKISIPDPLRVILHKMTASGAEKSEKSDIDQFKGSFHHAA